MVQRPDDDYIILKQLRSSAIAEIKMITVLADPFKHVMVPDMIHQTIGICINEVIAAFKILVYDLILKQHHMQFPKIQHTGADLRWLIVQNLV